MVHHMLSTQTTHLCGYLKTDCNISSNLRCGHPFTVLWFHIRPPTIKRVRREKQAQLFQLKEEFIQVIIRLYELFSHNQIIL